MKTLDLKKVTKEYNNLMFSLGRKCETIGTEWSDSTDDWGLVGMVNECKYVLSTYYKSGYEHCEMRRVDKDNRKLWYSETGRLERFIKKFEPFVK